MLEILSLGRRRDLAIALLLFVEWSHLKQEEHSFFAVQKSRSGKQTLVEAPLRSHLLEPRLWTASNRLLLADNTHKTDWARSTLAFRQGLSGPET